MNGPPRASRFGGIKRTNFGPICLFQNTNVSERQIKCVIHRGPRTPRKAGETEISICLDRRESNGAQNISAAIFSLHGTWAVPDLNQAVFIGSRDHLTLIHADSVVSHLKIEHVLHIRTQLQAYLIISPLPSPQYRGSSATCNGRSSSRGIDHA